MKNRIEYLHNGRIYYAIAYELSSGSFKLVTGPHAHTIIQSINVTKTFI